MSEDMSEIRTRHATKIDLARVTPTGILLHLIQWHRKLTYNPPPHTNAFPKNH